MKDLLRLDQLAAGRSFVHRLDPRAKVLATLVFILCLASFGRYEVTALLPFFIFPAVIIGIGDLPVSLILRKVALLSPFAFMVGIFNPILDHSFVINVGPFAVTAGWLSFASIVLRAMLTITTALSLVAVTGFPEIVHAGERLGMPRVFAVQLMFLYRYIFVLSEEGGRASRARELRSANGKGQGMGSYSSLVGNLLLRTWQRADRIHMAMLARGFNGAIYSGHELRFGTTDFLFLCGWSALFIILRLNNAAQLLGSLVTGR